jgi:arylsulfatase A-like enzyme
MRRGRDFVPSLPSRISTKMGRGRNSILRRSRVLCRVVLLGVLTVHFTIPTAQAVSTTTATSTTDNSQEESSTPQPERPPPTPNQRKGRTKRDPRDQPNFVLLFMDDLGYGDLGFTGHPTTRTPNLDQLAWNGKVMTTWYSGCAACTGSRVAFLTGRQWPRTGLPWVLGPVGNGGLPLDEVTLAEQLKKSSSKKKATRITTPTREVRDEDNHLDQTTTFQKGTRRPLAASSAASHYHSDQENISEETKHPGSTSSNADSTDTNTTTDKSDGDTGYATAIVGKWHLGQRPIYLPGNRGFDYYLGIPYSDDMGDGITTPCPTGDDDTATDRGTRSAPRNRRGLQNEDAKDNNDDSYHHAESDPSSSQNHDIDPAARYLPLVYQEFNQTRILEQPLDFTTLSDKYTAFATNFVTRHQDQPFLLYVPFSHVHVTSKSQPEQQYAGCRFQEHANATKNTNTTTTPRGSFGNALAEADAMVGSIVQTLQDLNLMENTLILFTSDNGPWLSRGLSAGSEGLFTGRYAEYYDTGKATTWEGRESFFVGKKLLISWCETVYPHSF